MKYYAVKGGRSTGIYNNWSDCESQVKGYSGNQYKSFSSREAAEAYMGGNNSNSNSNSTSNSYGNSSYSSSSYDNTPSYNYSSYSSYSSNPSKHSFPKSASETKTVNIYTDGASKNNQARKEGLSKAGYGVYYGPGDSRNHSGRVAGEQTNQRGELQGIHHALKNSCEEAKNGNGGKFVIHTDSQYSKDAITNWSNRWEQNDWKNSSGNDVAHQDLIKDCKSFIKTINDNNGSVEFVKVKGHSGNPGNEMADKLANEGCLK